METQQPLRRISRRLFLTTAAAAIGGAAVAACVAPAAPSTSPTSPAQPAAGGAAGKAPLADSVTFWTLLKRGDDNPRAKAETQILDNFEKQTGVKVQVEVTPFNELDKKLITAVAAGNGPDIARVDPLRLPLHWSANDIVSLQDYVNRDIPAQDRDDYVAWDYAVNAGQKWAFPVHITAYMLYYRKDLFDQAQLSPPKTWADFADAAKKLTVPGQRWGFGMGIARNAPFFAHIFFPLVWSAGGEILDPSGKAAYNSDAGVKAMQFVYDLVHTYNAVPQETVNYSYDDVQQLFMAGKLAMFMEGSHRYTTTQTSDTVKGKIGLADIPSWDGQAPAPEIMTGWHIAIPRPSNKKDTAWEFIKHYASKESQLIQSKVAGEIPTRKSVLADPFFDTPEAAHIKVFGQSLQKYGRPVPKTEHWDELLDGLLLAHHAVIQKQKSPKQALDDAAAAFNKLA